jgi:tetratricopeptide (TPR) repeat protein
MSLFQVQNLIGQSNYSDATMMCAAILAERPRDPEANYLMAQILTRTDRKSEAVPYAETALSIVPNNIRYMFMAARLYLDFELYELAFPLLKRVLIKEPKSTDANWAMADFLNSIGKGPDAIKHYEQVILSLTPGKPKSLAQQDLASCLINMGKSEEALLILAQLSKSEYFSQSALLLAAFAEKAGPESETGQTISALLQSKTLSKEFRSDCLLALGRLFENIKSYDEAFNHWKLSRDMLGVETFNLATQQKQDAALKNFYSSEMLKEVAQYGHPSRAPVFILGMPRSGTTLTEQIIAAHSKAQGVGELNRFSLLQTHFLNDYSNDANRRRLFDNARKGELKARAQETIDLYDILTDQKSERIVEKTPMNFLAVGYLKLCFPFAKFVHCRRHPADNFISAYQNQMNRAHDYAYDQSAYANSYVMQDKMVQYWRSIGIDIFELDYETLTSEPEPTARKLLEHLELEWEPDCLNFYKKERSVRTFSTLQVRNAVNTSSVERWKKYEKHLGPFFKTLQDLGYQHEKRAGSSQSQSQPRQASLS